MREPLNSQPGSAPWIVIPAEAFILLLLSAVALMCGNVVAQSVPQSAPTPNLNLSAPAPQRHEPQGERPSVLPGAAAPQPVRQMVNNGTIEGFVYWDANTITHAPEGDCSGLAVTVAVDQSSNGSYTPLATLSNNFKYVGQVKQFLVGGKVKVYNVCTYGYGKVPVGTNLQVTVNVTSPAAFSPISVPQNPTVSQINIINAQCNLLPRIVNPAASDLFSKWGTCQNMAFDVNFEITKAAQLSRSSGGAQLGSGGVQVLKNPGPAGTPLLNRPGKSTLLDETGSPTHQAQARSAAPLGNSGQDSAGSHQTYAGGAQGSTPGSKVELNPQPFPPKQLLTNHDVITMLEAKVAESVILSSLRSSVHKFDFSAPSCRDLQGAHVTANILNAMGDGSVRPCSENISSLIGNDGSSSGARQAITDITNRVPAAVPNPHSSRQGTKDSAASRTRLQPWKLPAPTLARKATSPYLSEQNRTIIAVLDQQKQFAEQESSAMQSAVAKDPPSVPTRTVTIAANLRANAPPQELAPGQTQDAHATFTSIAHMPAFNSVVLTCSTDPTPRIFRVNGGQTPGIFTPEAKYNLYTITGCSFGPFDPSNSAYIFGVNGFKENLNIDFWSENGITAHLDPWLAGVLDQDNVTLVVAPKGKQPFNKSGYKFYAARGMPAPDGGDQDVTLAYNSMPMASVSLFDASPVPAGYNQVPPSGASQFPSFSFQGSPVAGWVFRYAYGQLEMYSGLIGVDCFINDVGYQLTSPSDPCAYFDRSALGSDTWDFSKLVPGFVISAYGLYYEDIDPTQLCGSWDDYRKDSGLLGNWDFNLTAPTQITVVWPLSWCKDTELPPSGLINEQKQSVYGLAVWVLGPRCIDPWTGQKDQACVNQVKQKLS